MICAACEAPNDEAATHCIACGEPLAPGQVSPRPGLLFAGRYQILAPLGRGGMGMVYRAHDTHLDETIALKLIRPDLARQTHLRDRFRSEIKLARRIRHRNVCSVFGDGEHEGVFFVCMELVDGVDLRRLIKERHGLPPEQAFDVAIQVGEGLQAIHESGIIHRDLKPANVMLDSRGLVRVMDFGLAKQWLVDDAGGLTGTGLAVGTPDYMSPEQARGEKPSFASDVYSLGVVVFELFTGEPPFRSDTPLSTLLKQLTEPPPLDGAARLPAVLVPVLRRALAKSPSDRYASAAEMTRALRSAAAMASAVEGATPTFVQALPAAPGAGPSGVAAQSTRHASEAPAVGSRPRQALGTSATFTRVITAVAGPRGWRLAVGLVVLVGLPLLGTLQLRRAAAPGGTEIPAPPAMPPATMAARPPLAPPPPDPAATQPPPAAMAPPGPAPPSSTRVDESGELIRHEPIGCLVEGRFPLVAASFRAEPAEPPRVVFRSALGSEYYFVTMARDGGRWVGKLPKPLLAASPIGYYVQVTTRGQGQLRTREVSARVVKTPSACPPGASVAQAGPPGAVTVFSATRSFVALKDALGLEALVASLKDPDAGVREQAAASIASMVPPLKTLVEKSLAALESQDADDRERAAEDLGEMAEVIVKEAMLPLIAALGDQDPAVEIKAAESLGEIGPPVAAAARSLRAALRDPQPGVRRSAAQALGSIGSVVGAALTALESVPEGRGPGVQRAAAEAHRRIEAASR